MSIVITLDQIVFMLVMVLAWGFTKHELSKHDSFGWYLFGAGSFIFGMVLFIISLM